MSEGMSEDERKKIIEFITKDLKALGYNEYLIGIIKETFDLYQKEKEKNKKLEIELEIKKYCKVNELANDLIYYKNLAKEYQGNYISKDKIREKIKELEDIKYAESIEGTLEDIKLLKELLEENNEKQM